MCDLVKWRALVLVLATAVLGLGSGAGVGEQSLREAARGSGLLIGTAVRPAQLSEAAYASTLAREFNTLEPEDALKWEVVHSERQSFDFSQADQIVDFASRHDTKVRGHTLVWHRQNSKWLTEGKYTSGELAEILEKHIKTVVEHYRGKIFAWDVVNEAFDELHPGQLRSTIWRDQPGIGLAGKGISQSRMRSMPWFVISGSAVSPSTAWDYRCTLLTCTQMPRPFLQISGISLVSACRSTSPRWTLPFRLMLKAILA